MSDLISRKKVISILEQLEEHSLSGKMDISNAIYLLEKQPTAYDIDNVVEELEENASRYTKKYTTPYGNNGYRDTKAISIHKAIEIVKQGGVYDDVCEWKMDNVGASIGCRSDIHHTGYVNEIYCPFCKKKIKVVE